MPRQTSDLIALILASVVALVVLLTAITLLYLTVTHPERDTATGVDAMGKIISVLVGALVGFMAGRRVNGHS